MRDFSKITQLQSEDANPGLADGGAAPWRLRPPAQQAWGARPPHPPPLTASIPSSALRPQPDTVFPMPDAHSRQQATSPPTAPTHSPRSKGFPSPRRGPGSGQGHTGTETDSPALADLQDQSGGRAFSSNYTNTRSRTETRATQTHGLATA